MDPRAPVPPLRPIEIKRIRHEGAGYFLLRDPLELAGPDALLVPVELAPLLALLDGEHGMADMMGALQAQYGSGVDLASVVGVVERLRQACLLDDEYTAAARRAALAAYHAEPCRPPALAGRVYPADAAMLRAQLGRFGVPTPEPVADGITGVISPHIDYARGGPVYARLWHAARQAARDAEVAVIFGTDHSGSLNQVTLTAQDYATPWGVLPTDRDAHGAVAAALGDDAFLEELHHRGEHSVELAAVWLHHARDGEPLPIVPVLCGHPGGYMRAGSIGAETPAGRAVAALRSALAGRRVLAVAAADLAHVGPAFGDPAPFGPSQKAEVRAADAELIAAMTEGAGGVLRAAGRIDDRYRICGLAPIACMLDLIGPSEPETLAYDQCPADDTAGSIVSVAGVLLRKHGNGR